MAHAAEIIAFISARALYLAPILLAALFIGEPLAYALRFPKLRRYLSTRMVQLGQKLNRPNRSIATRLYRGVVALGMLLLPAVALGLLLTYPADWLSMLHIALLVALFGELLQPYTLVRIRRAAKNGTLNLQSTAPPHLFADTHARLRYHILTSADHVSLTVGASLYYLVTGMPGLVLYLTLAAAARTYNSALTGTRAFGWAATGLFTLLDAIPRAATGVLLWLASLFTPGTRPLHTLRHFATAAPSFHGWIAYLLNLALGGPIPTAAGQLTLPWIGHGTPKPESRDMTRALQLLAIALLLWILVLSSTIYYL